MKIKFICLASGSSGNCFYLGTDDFGILIDAGIPVRTIKGALKEVGLDFDRIMGVFVTHDHADHIKSLGTLGEKYNIPIYATKATHVGINKNYCMTQKLVSCMRYIEKEETIRFRDFNITAFEVPHDGNDNVGYYIETSAGTFCFITDIGHITAKVAEYIDKANYLILEANYDEEMLDMGPYPQYLKERIKGPNGHMCNKDTANFLAENIHEGLKFVGLCHLSKENNHPDLAYKTIELSLRSRGIIIGKDLQLTVLKRNTPTGIYSF